MSYKNPKISFADPLAFQKGFQQAFKDVPNFIQQQRDKVEREAKEKKREQQLLKLSQSRVLSEADIGQITGIDIDLNQKLQDSVNSIVVNDEFAKASPVEQQKMIQKVRYLKAVYGKIGEIAGMDADDWDNRNDSRLTALKTAINNNNVKIEGEGLDMRFVLPDGRSITTNEISNLRVFDKTPFRESFNELNEETIKLTNNAMIELQKMPGKDPNVAIAKAEKDYMRILEAKGDAYFFFFFENKLSDEEKMEMEAELGIAKYKDPEILSKLPPDEADAIEEKQKELIGKSLFSKNILPNLINPSDYVDKPTTPTTIIKTDPIFDPKAIYEFKKILSKFNQVKGDAMKTTYLTLDILKSKLGKGGYKYNSGMNEVTINTKYGNDIVEEKYKLNSPRDISILLSRVTGSGASITGLPTSERQYLADLSQLLVSDEFMSAFLPPKQYGPITEKDAGKDTGKTTPAGLPIYELDN